MPHKNLYTFETNPGLLREMGRVSQEHRRLVELPGTMEVIKRIDGSCFFVNYPDYKHVFIVIDHASGVWLVGYADHPGYGTLVNKKLILEPPKK